MKPSMITANFTGVTRHDTMEGEDYLVAPMVMIVEGVLNGSGGPLYYPAEELGKTPQIWNHKPVVVYHPQRNGEGISACDPDILTNRKIGVIMNTKFEDGKLMAEAWMKPSRIDVIDNRISEAIEKQEMLELSTGLFTDNESMEGEFNGTHYDGIARNYRPDHLAILPDVKGACSIEDGAGFLRLNEMGFGTIRNLLSGLLREKNDEAWIEEVYESFFIYEQGGQLYKQDYTIPKEGEVSFTGDPQEVVRVIEYRTKEGQFVANAKRENWLSDNITVNNERDLDMKKKDIVDGLIANKFMAWKDEDREGLMAMDKKVLEKMQPVANDDDTQEAAEDGAGDMAVAAPAEAPAEAAPAEAPAEEAAPTENKERTVEECLADMPPKIRAVVQNGIDAHDREKTHRIKQIMNSDANPFSEEELKLKDLVELRQLAVFAVNSSKTEENAPTRNQMLANDFSGQGNVFQDNMETNEDALVIPSVVGSEE